MGGLNPVYVYIVVGKHGTPHRGNAHSLVLKPHLVYEFGYYSMHHTMAASGAVVHVDLSEQARAAVHLIGRGYNFFWFHCRNLLDFSICPSENSFRKPQVSLWG